MYAGQATILEGLRSHSLGLIHPRPPEAMLTGQKASKHKTHGSAEKLDVI